MYRTDSPKYLAVSESNHVPPRHKQTSLHVLRIIRISSRTASTWSRSPQSLLPSSPSSCGPSSDLPFTVKNLLDASASANAGDTYNLRESHTRACADRYINTSTQTHEGIAARRRHTLELEGGTPNNSANGHQ